MRKTLVLVATLVVIVGVASAALAALSWRSSPSDLTAFFIAPKEVKSMRFIVSDITHSGLGRIRFGGVTVRFFDGVDILEYASEAGRSIALLRTSSGGTDVYDISAAPRGITNDQKPKEGLGLSPDGRFVTYSSRTPAFEDVPENVFDIRRYTTTILDIETAENRTFAGAWGHFVDGTHFFYFSPEGLVVRNLETGAVSSLADSLSYRTTKPPAYDGTLFGVENVFIPRFDVFRLTSLEPVLFEPVVSIPFEDGYSAAIDGDVAYVLSLSDGKFSIIKHTLNGTRDEPILSVEEGIFNPQLFYIQ